MIFSPFYFVSFSFNRTFAPETYRKKIMSYEERKSRMAVNRAVNSKKPARSAFMRWARAHKGAFIINDPELRAQLAVFAE